MISCPYLREGLDQQSHAPRRNPLVGQRHNRRRLQLCISTLIRGRISGCKAYIVRTNYDVIYDIICDILNDIINEMKIYVNYYYMISYMIL
jgi:hypothetical protein